MKKMMLIFILSTGYLFSQSDSSKKFDIVSYQGNNSFYIYILHSNGIYYYNFSSKEITNFKEMFWKESKTMPIDTSMYKPYLTRTVRLDELNERIAKELK